MAAHESLGRQFIHTTNAKLRKGQIIRPAAELGIKSKWSHVKEYSANHVYMSDARVPTHEIEHFGEHDYHVEPLGPVERDPEYVSWKRSVVRHGRNSDAFDRLDRVGLNGRYSYRTTAARVIGRKKETTLPDDDPGIQHGDTEALLGY